MPQSEKFIVNSRIDVDCDDHSNQLAFLMAKAVFTSKVSPVYDDLPEVRYHFPKTYLRQVEMALNDWVIYYEPRRSTGDLSSSGGGQAYYATARVQQIVADTQRTDHFYALVTDYIEFDRAVMFAEGGHYYESLLQKGDGSTNKGAFGRAVRVIPDSEYNLILQAGFAHVLGREPRKRLEPEIQEDPLESLTTRYGFSEASASWLGPDDEPLTQDREIVSKLISRPFRDRAFSAAVKSAYQDTCAVTGIKIINGGGRSEVQAAHIRPVGDSGPDSLRNGIALSGTAHWMFDRGLISVDDDYSILIAKDKLTDAVIRMIRDERRLLLPQNPIARPHIQFLTYHREYVFKG